ncbi:MAG: hypothetical protein KAR20_18290 [Candidatus Heimdallarchaeota archaeon]|nr:hypothetical protein [Candidatus Heimdallarchaeota archaeon]
MAEDIQVIKIKEYRTAFPWNTPKNTIVIDVEVSEGLICVFGYYHVGSTHIHQLIFLDPITPEYFIQSPLFHEIIAGDVKIAAYNTKFERELLQIPKDREMIELQPSPYYPKENYIQLKSLDQTSAKNLPPYGPKTIKKWVFHNYSCLIKQIILLQGKNSFAKPNIKEIFLKQLRGFENEQG